MGLLYEFPHLLTGDSTIAGKGESGKGGISHVIEIFSEVTTTASPPDLDTVEVCPSRVVCLADARSLLSGGSGYPHDKCRRTQREHAGKILEHRICTNVNKKQPA